jgi:hypothetical protein
MQEIRTRYEAEGTEPHGQSSHKRWDGQKRIQQRAGYSIPATKYQHLQVTARDADGMQLEHSSSLTCSTMMSSCNLLYSASITPGGRNLIQQQEEARVTQERLTISSESGLERALHLHESLRAARTPRQQKRS